jgi:hypothetical protein
MTKADTTPELTVKTKNQQGAPALTKIAELVHPENLKLKRRHATAEGLLSERKQQSRL